MHCSVCKKDFKPSESTSLPFCSERCKTMDLGRWLDEGYSLPVESNPDEDVMGEWSDN